MLEENSVGLIFEEFEKNVKEFALSDITLPHYKITDFFYKDDIKEKKGYIYYNNFIIVFVYSFDSFMTAPKSVLECRICFLKKSIKHEYPFYDVLEILNPNDFKCYFFPYIECADRMKGCFVVLAEALRGYLPELQAVAEDDERLALLASQHTSNLKILYGKFFTPFEDDSELSNAFYEENYHSMVHMCFASARYNDFLKGDYQKAKKKYAKMKKLIGYEKRLLEFLLKMQPGEMYAAVNPELNTLDEGLKEALGSYGIGILLFSNLVFTPLIFAALASLFLLSVKLIFREAEYVTNLDLISALSMFFPAIFVSILLSYHCREWIAKRIYRKYREKRILYDKIMNRKHEERLMRKFTYIILTGCFLFMLLSVNSNLAFYSTGFRNNLKFFSLNGEYIRYDSIDSVWELPGRENSFGMWIDNTYFVILLKNGEKLDFSADVYHEQFSEKIIPILTGKGVKSCTVTSEDKITLIS